MSALAMVDLDLFRRVSMFRAKKDVRYYLNGVHIEPNAEGGVLICATNGHTLIVGFDPKGTCAKSVIVHVHGRAFTARSGAVYPDCIKVENLPNAGDPRAVVVSHIHNLTSVDLRLGHTIDGKFPDWRATINPKAKPMNVAPGWLDPAYLSLVGAAMSGFVLRGSVRMLATDEEGPVYVQVARRDADACDLLAVIMPMRNREDRQRRDDGTPAWLPVYVKPKSGVAA